MSKNNFRSPKKYLGHAAIELEHELIDLTLQLFGLQVRLVVVLLQIFCQIIIYDDAK